ncbi:MAG: hypothetical protein K8T90_06460 [Planctomycetes bacterium]|nr:hypothetical protein [Planctomycetota bacterium]
MGRATVTGVLGFAVGVATGLIVALFVLGVTADGPTVVLGTAPSRSDPRSETMARRDAPPRARAAVADSNHDARSSAANTSQTVLVLPPREPGDPDVREFVLPDAPTGFAELEVQVIGGDGEPNRGEHILVVPADGGFDRQHDETDAFAGGETGEGGIARIRVPSPGRYTVQVDLGMYAVARHGIVAPSSGRVVLSEPTEENVSLTLSDDPGAENVVVTATALAETIALTDGTSVVGLAGSGWNVTLNQGQRSATISSPPGLPFRLTAPPGWAVESDVVRTPAVVHVVRAPPLIVPVAATIRTAEGPAACERQIDLVFDTGSGPLDGWAFYLDGESIDGDCAEWTVPTKSEKGVLRWWGPEVEPGSAAYDLSSSDRLAIDVRHRPAPGLAAPRVVLEPSPWRAPDSRVEGVLWNPLRRGDEIREARLWPGKEVALPSPGSWVVVPSELDPDNGDLDDHVAGPVRLSGGVLYTMREVVGGYAVVVPRTPPPRGSGAIEIARADGAPLLIRTSTDESFTSARADADAGTILGPFEPGEVVFDVFVGRVRWQRLAVLIRAGEKTALLIGPFSPPPR